LAILFTLPSLWNGFQSDDLSHRYVLLQKTGPYPPPAESRIALFSFVPHNPERTMAFVDWGVFPWWTHPDLRLSLFRPLTSLTHILDYALWPNSAFMMHVHSLAWYAFLVWVAAALYRRWLGVGRAAGLAALFYALDDAHGFGAGWLANRNAVICASLGLAALLLHDRWRVERKAALGIAAAATYAAGLLAGEGAVAASAFLFTYAIFLDNPRRGESASLLRRLASIAPYVGIGLIYVINYKIGEYGARLSGVYIDPVTEPARFLRYLVVNGPSLLVGQLGMPPSEIVSVISPTARLIYSGLCSVGLLVIGFIAWPTIFGTRANATHSATAKMLGIGMLISILPISATFPSNRLLFFVGFGAMGLVACLLDRICAQSSTRPVRIIAWVMFLVHGVMGPLGLPINSMGFRAPIEFLNRGIASFPYDAPEIESKHVVAITNPIPLYASMIALEGSLQNKTLPLSFRTLASSTSDVEVERLDDRTLRIRPADAFNPGIDRDRPSGHEPFVDVQRMFVMLDSLFRDPEAAFQVGEVIALKGMTIEITETNARGLATEALFRFDVPLEDNSLMWVKWDKWEFHPSQPPKIGEKIVIKKT